MFNKSGRKIKALAIISFIIFVIGSFIIFSDLAHHSTGWLIFIPVSIFFSYLICLLIYAFEDMCENIDLIRSNLYIISTVTENRFPDLAEKDTEDEENSENEEDSEVIEDEINQEDQ